MGEIVLVRHGQASFGAAVYDELSALGRQQGALLGTHWAASGAPFDHVFTGPAKRHVDTQAEVAAKIRDVGRPWPDAVVVPELDEHDSFALVAQAATVLRDDPEYAALMSEPHRKGSFQRQFELVMRRWIDGAVSVDGVETFEAFRDRVLAGLTRLADASRDGARVVAFSSVGPVAVMLAHVLDVPPARGFQTAWRVRNASITSFVHGRGRFTLERFNALPHLADLGTHTFR